MIFNKFLQLSLPRLPSFIVSIRLLTLCEKLGWATPKDLEWPWLSLAEFGWQNFEQNREVKALSIMPAEQGKAVKQGMM